jgi:hypothetical protein
LERSAQFIDQVSLWVARHLIWLRTRRLYRNSLGGISEIFVPMPGEPVGYASPSGQFWRGHWAGPRARATTAAEHVRSISPNTECWCGSGTNYGGCHRPREAAVQTTGTSQ